MFAIIIGLIVIALVVTLLLKGYYPQAILFMGGVVLFSDNKIPTRTVNNKPTTTVNKVCGNLMEDVA